ncbi:uncharacterized protein VICG_00165 [Vittaforma corneae ATCC 50505]|uniref:Golgi protein n=1 Tax=Vittaforma corneae (strain ATCC 50505) TaxID=993615 RepID=L2GQQ6_VITCO|nr:uncharacterized protein VICG_00165 [Vittaforma corneae ATCC 50505]ELA42850.1 hypothetical protein VICG_00165 [Vittaforma corneae ATCC 50505]
MGGGENKVDIYSKIAAVPSSIQILGAPNSSQSAESPKLDEIDANAHETFTLEEMRVLIMSYRKKNKDFLIARVTTPDPENNSLFYNFYYAAAEINRILFRYEPSRRLLHRMKVKNPLNNMYIIGQVFYYKITPQDVDKAIVNFLFNQVKEKDKSRKAFSAIFRHKHDFSRGRKTQKSKDSMDIQEQRQIVENLDGKSSKEIIENISVGKIPMPEKIDFNKKIKYDAKYFASDDDFLIKQDVRDYFKRNALEPEDEFLYDLDRTQNDFMALIDDDSEEEEEEVNDWRRVLSAHISLALSMLFVCLLMGGGPGIAIIFLPLAVIIFFSFISSLCYVLCCRRSTFDTLAVNSIEDEL